MCPCSGGTYREENEIRTQEIKNIPMANRKYDYSEDVRQPAESASEMAKTSETEEATAVSAEEARRQRLEQRNDALANEFRRLKPEIAEAYRLLNKLIEGIGAYAGTMINLHDLLKTSFPIRFTENDIQALLDEINAIADNAISHIRKEREKADKDIRRNENRISITQVTFWCMTALLLILATFFVLVIFANMKLIHSEVLTQISVVYSGLTVLTIGITAYIYRRK
jgi:chromosome segregation ATPase